MKTALVIASYKEVDALPILLSEIVKFLDESDVVVIADDSPLDFRSRIQKECDGIFQNSEASLLLSFGDIKGGRGNAIRRGIRLVLDSHPDIDYVIEMDADSSHQPEDIKKIRDIVSESDLIIGSRYLKASKIIGWPLSRRVFSKSLNILIPRLLGINIKDITNGLRRYKTKSAILFLAVEPKNLGFTYLSEQALILHRAGCLIEEIPTTFVNRTVGKSTVTHKEIISSLRGIFELVKSNR